MSLEADSKIKPETKIKEKTIEDEEEIDWKKYKSQLQINNKRNDGLNEEQRQKMRSMNFYETY